MTQTDLMDLAAEEGFAAAVVIPTDQIQFDPSFRPYCAENLCGQYGVNHSCPPDCGSPEEMKAKILRHKYALVLQSIWEIDDFSDTAAIKESKSAHNQGAIRLMKQARAGGTDGFLVGASGCALCKPCAKASGEPCRFPDLMYSCMSAYCIFVKKLADACGLEYDCGAGQLAFFGMYVFD